MKTPVNDANRFLRPVERESGQHLYEQWTQVRDE
jgi:hypothetical protein